MPPSRPLLPSWCLPLLATWLAYLVLGRAGLLLAIPPGYASPLYPAAGVALAAVLVWGRPAVLGVALGSMSVNLLLGGVPWWVPLGLGLGAMAQALAGAALVRRFVAQPLALGEPRDLLRFFLLGALLACLVSASVGVAVLSASGALAPGTRLLAWLTWAAGDALGVLIGAPIMLTLIGQPRADWAPRRLTLGLPLLAVTFLMGLGIRQVSHIDEERQRHAFEREAASASGAVVARLQEPLRALEAARGVFIASNDVDRDEFRRATEAWLLPGSGLQALGWSERVPRAQVPAFENRVRDASVSGFRVFDRTGADAAPAAAKDADVVALTYIEPQKANAGALGINVLSIAAAREAVGLASRTGRPAATAGFTLTQGGTGVVVYQALYKGTPSLAADRQQALTGVVFATLRLDDLLRAQGETLPGHLRLCLVDNDRLSPGQVLAGPGGCAALPDGVPQHVRPLAFAGRQWDVRVFAEGGLPEARGIGNTWPFSIVGLLATAMLGALLLTMTGRSRRIERAVDERTADLQREVGERKRTETALRESEQRFRNILDHVPIGVIYTDLTGRIKEANPKLRDMLGYSADELALMNAKDLTHPDDLPADLALTKRLLAGEIPMFRRQKRSLRKDGQTAWVLAVTTVLRNAFGEPQRLVGVVEDITERLKLEEAERARERAEAASLAKSDFLSRMSHELRTPLNAMLGFAQLLELDRQQPLAAHQMAWTAQIQQAGWHLLHMINDTLDLSRIESGTLRLTTEALDVPSLLRATRSLLAHNAERRAVQVLETLDPLADTVSGDLTRVKQILTNLLSNAIKYNVEGGRVMLATRLHDANTVRIEVSDTGLGMTEQQLADLFQPFNRLGREVSGEEGTGIGLVISQRLAELMGGSLDAQSEAGKGSTFVLLLPRARSTETAQALGGASAQLPASYHQRLVHYVEDNETNAEVMRGILAQRPQVKLEVSGTGLDGLAAIRQRPPSLVLLDMHLPDIDGLELLRHLKRDDATADIPVVIVSADATAARIHEALTSGAAQYLTKPVNVAEILAVLDEQLEQLETRFG